MAQVAQALTPEDLTAVSSWLASQPLPAQTHAIDRLPTPTPIPCGSAALPAGPQKP